VSGMNTGKLYKSFPKIYNKVPKIYWKDIYIHVKKSSSQPCVMKVFACFEATPALYIISPYCHHKRVREQFTMLETNQYLEKKFHAFSDSIEQWQMIL
jgi:hypothetical protein